jgi:hypothetical protein
MVIGAPQTADNEIITIRDEPISSHLWPSASDAWNAAALLGSLIVSGEFLGSLGRLTIDSLKQYQPSKSPYAIYS